MPQNGWILAKKGKYPSRGGRHPLMGVHARRVGVPRCPQAGQWAPPSGAINTTQRGSTHHPVRQYTPPSGAAGTTPDPNLYLLPPAANWHTRVAYRHPQEPPHLSQNNDDHPCKKALYQRKHRRTQMKGLALVYGHATGYAMYTPGGEEGTYSHVVWDGWGCTRVSAMEYRTTPYQA